MITKLSLKNVGPAPTMEVEFSPRLNIITGDNGLGKTFILDAAWFALTRTWAGENMFMPLGRGTRQDPPQIHCAVVGKTGVPIDADLRFDFDEQDWTGKQARAPMPGLVIYARIDGGFSVWDPARNHWRDRKPEEDAGAALAGPGRERPRAYQFSKEEVWNGLSEPMGDTRRDICNGLIRDVESWRLKGNGAFNLLQEILATLSPDDVELMTLGEGMRVSIDDVRDVPTLVLPYGAVPVTKAAAGMKRVLALAYLIVWAWEEHKLASRALQIAPTERMVVLFDEVEAHLHPKWQRRFVPAIIGVITRLVNWSGAAEMQFVCTTHAPLVLASVETLFDEDTDTLFHIQLSGDRTEVKSLPWAARGAIGYWLTSEVFGLSEARSKEAETAIRAAKDFMAGRQDRLPANMRTKETIHEELKRTLPGQDPFWPRWMVKTGLED